MSALKIYCVGQRHVLFRHVPTIYGFIWCLFRTRSAHTLLCREAGNPRLTRVGTGIVLPARGSSDFRAGRMDHARNAFLMKDQEKSRLETEWIEARKRLAALSDQLYHPTASRF